jgi:nucleotide-binding universal stress UspA family protein
MFKTIVWATDGSKTAAHALPFALELVERDQAQLVAVHVREVAVGRMGGYPLIADDEDVRKRLGEQVEALRERGVDAALVVRSCIAGHAAKLIADVAAEHEADVIVLGTHGHTRLGGALIGSTTQALLHSGRLPVFAVPDGARVHAAAHA